jgi:hypothetical protein
MFGLEGSGFVVCLGVILFLIGLVMFYVRQRFSDIDAKVNQVISIIPVMTQQIQLHEQELHPSMYHEDAAKVAEPLPSIPEEGGGSNGKIDVSESDDIDSDEGSDVDSDVDSDDELEEQDTKQIKNIVLGSEMIPPEDNTPGAAIHEGEVKLVTMGIEADEVLSSGSDDEDNTVTTMSPDDPADELTEITIPITATAETEVDYTKLSVAALRQLVSERGLSSHTSKLKKTECIN